MTHPIRKRALTFVATLIFLVAAAGRTAATDFTQFDVVKVRIASLSPTQCQGATSPDCLRVGVVVLIRQKSGTIASISTQYITGGSLVGEVRRDFGLHAPMVIRLTSEALQTAATQDQDAQTRKNAQKFLPSLDAERSYTLGEGVTPTPEVERLLGKIADAFRQKTGKRLAVTGAGADAVDLSVEGLSGDEQKALGDAVLDVGGASVSAAGTPTVFRVQFKPARLKLWVNAFLPGQIDNLTFPLVQGPHMGETVLEGPKPGAKECFLTDQRSFSDDPSSSFRVQALVEIDMAASTLKLTSGTGKTLRLSCDKGTVQCDKRAGADRIRAKNFSSETLGGGDRRYFVTLEAAAGNPCVDLTGVSIPSPDIDLNFRISVLFERSTGKVRVSFDGMIEPFPAFEMYAIHNGTKPTALFREGPLPGSGPWSLPGSPNRAVTVVSKEVQ
jgi:hypothetical protein